MRRSFWMVLLAGCAAPAAPRPLPVQINEPPAGTASVSPPANAASLRPAPAGERWISAENARHSTFLHTKRAFVFSVRGTVMIDERQTVDLFSKAAGSVRAVAVSDGHPIAKDDFLITIETKREVFPVQSPLFGQVVRVLVEVGDPVVPQGRGATKPTKLAVLNDLDRVVVQTPQSLPNATAGTNAHFRIKSLPQLDFIGLVEPTPAASGIRVSFANPDHRLVPGAQGDLSIEAPATAQALPRPALLLDGKSVLIHRGATDDGRIRLVETPVQILFDNDPDTVIVSGITEADEVVLAAP